MQHVCERFAQNHLIKCKKKLMHWIPLHTRHNIIAISQNKSLWLAVCCRPALSSFLRFSGLGSESGIFFDVFIFLIIIAILLSQTRDLFVFHLFPHNTSAGPQRIPRSRRIFIAMHFQVSQSCLKATFASMAEIHTRTRVLTNSVTGRICKKIAQIVAQSTCVLSKYIHNFFCGKK
jgi:hypothetical protein